MTTRIEKQTQKSGGAQRAAAAATRSKAPKSAKRPAKASSDGQRIQPDVPAAASSDQHRAMIATAAYYLAEKRGFTPGSELDDWLTAEAEITALHLSRAAPPAG